MTKIKICGITNFQDASWAVTLGTDYLGFNFYRKSPRKISPGLASEIINKLPQTFLPVGVFVDDEIENIIKVIEKCKLKLVQLHGKESPEFCSLLATRCLLPLIKTFRIKGEGTLKYISRYKDVVDYFLLDAYLPQIEGGTGEVFNWDIALKIKEVFNQRPIFLAGGLTQENVKSAIEKVKPYCVDVASGIERLPRRKDYDKLKNFIIAVKSI